jgi:hypothetical protein
MGVLGGVSPIQAGQAQRLSGLIGIWGARRRRLSALISAVIGWHIWAHADVVGPRVLRTTDGRRWGSAYAHPWSEVTTVGVYGLDFIYAAGSYDACLEIAFSSGPPLRLTLGHHGLDEHRLEEIARYAAEHANLPITRARTPPEK